MYEKYFKRALDVLISLSALIVLSPVFLILTVLGWIFMRGNPFFVQQRPGKDEQIFYLIKFRTMNNARDAKGTLLPDHLRLSRYGRFLRKTSLDELPELVDILFGKMSLIGPRPLLCSYLPFYTEKERRRHSVRPGLTGLAQVHGRNALAWEQRFEIDVSYVDHITFLEDLRILFLTVKKVIIQEDILMGEEKCIQNLDIERGGSTYEREKSIRK